MSSTGKIIVSLNIASYNLLSNLTLNEFREIIRAKEVSTRHTKLFFKLGA